MVRTPVLPSGSAHALVRDSPHQIHCVVALLNRFILYTLLKNENRLIVVSPRLTTGTVVLPFKWNTVFFRQ